MRNDNDRPLAEYANEWLIPGVPTIEGPWKKIDTTWSRYCQRKFRVKNAIEAKYRKNEALSILINGSMTRKLSILKIKILKMKMKLLYLLYIGV